MKGDRTNQKKRMIGWYLHENAAAIASWAGMDFVGLLSRTTWRGDKLRRVNRVACGGCLISVGVKPACSAFDSAKVSSGPGPTQCFFVCRQSQRRFQDSQMVCSNCHAQKLLYRHVGAHTCVYEYLLWRVWPALERCLEHRIDWYCLYYSMRNSLVALLEVLFAGIFLRIWDIGALIYIFLADTLVWSWSCPSLIVSIPNHGFVNV